MKNKELNHRRDFLKKCSLSTFPFLLPSFAYSLPSQIVNNPLSSKIPSQVNFIYDGLSLSPQEYFNKLQSINKINKIEQDFYGNGGTTKLLEKRFAEITGKEKAIYLPTGTMANQLAVKLLNDDKTKVIVPENSHIFRDEADAAQSVHGKRLIPIGKGKSYFNLTHLKDAINYIDKNEVFKSGLGTIVIENPVRRANGTYIPIEEIKQISNYCRANNYKMHLDGARIHLASAYSNTSPIEYASYFDTVYISLYKYLNASGGAILCGDAKLIDRIPHQMKILGGTVFQSWNNTAMAQHYLENINDRWKKIISISSLLFNELNKIKGINIKALKDGTNIFNMELDNDIQKEKLGEYLYKEHNILFGRTDSKGSLQLVVNESLLSRDPEVILTAWKTGIEKARI